MADTIIKRKNYKFNKGGFPGKDTGSESKTEPEYMPAEVQINRLIRSGEKLAQYRKDMFDIGWDQEFDDIPLDPTRNGAYDLADASDDLEAIAGRAKQTPAEETEAENDDNDSSTTEGEQNADDSTESTE